MSKEMTPLQALGKIKQAEYFVDFELDAKVCEDYKKELDIIEKALVKLEKAENCVFTSKEDVKKEHKVIEVIKKYFTYNFDEFYAAPTWYKDYKKYEKLLSEMFDE